MKTDRKEIFEALELLMTHPCRTPYPPPATLLLIRSDLNSALDRCAEIEFLTHSADIEERRDNALLLSRDILRVATRAICFLEEHGLSPSVEQIRREIIEIEKKENGATSDSSVN